MGILRKYLWLVLPIVFFANYANADTCENDPYACTPAKLCSKTTEKINNVLYWISSEEDKHLKVARKINLNCGAKDAMSSCQKDASECSILELCEVAVTKEVSATNWNEINPQHVKLAKSFGLDCGVSHSAVSNTSTSPCDENPSACISEALCEKATHDGFGKKEWRTGYYKNYVKEAKQRGLTCGVKSTSIDKTCSQDVLKCTPFELCKLATKKNANGKNIWSMAEYRKKYIEEAQRRNISCGVNYTKNAKTCSQDVLKCTPSELCDAATYTINKTTDWKVGAYKKYVKEAKRRNISCGVKSTSNDQVKADEKARIALEAEKKRRADEKAKLALAAEKKRKADEKAKLALAAEKKRKADEKAKLALAAEKKRKADEKARLALKAEEKRKADEKARLALAAEEKRKADEADKNLVDLIYNLKSLNGKPGFNYCQLVFEGTNNTKHNITGMGKKISVFDTDGDIISVYNLLGPLKKEATSATNLFRPWIDRVCSEIKEIKLEEMSALQIDGEWTLDFDRFIKSEALNSSVPEINVHPTSSVKAILAKIENKRKAAENKRKADEKKRKASIMAYQCNDTVSPPKMSKAETYRLIKDIEKLMRKRGLLWASQKFDYCIAGTHNINVSFTTRSDGMRFATHYYFKQKTWKIIPFVGLESGGASTCYTTVDRQWYICG